MSVQLIPAPLPELSRKPFIFSPGIRGMKDSQWILRRANLAELTVSCVATGEELTIARRWMDGISLHEPENDSDTQSSPNVVSLTQELEFAGGRVVPLRRGVLKMPALDERPSDTRAAFHHQRRGSQWKAPVVAIRVEGPHQSTLRRVVKGSIAVGFVAFVAMVLMTKDAQFAARLGVLNRTASQEITFTSGDGYQAIVTALGEPVSDRWIEPASGDGFRRLGYPQHRLAILMAGDTKDTSHYVGAVDRRGTLLHTASPAADAARLALAD